MNFDTVNKCYDNWSRCSPQTQVGNGYLWKPCEEYCQKCKGKATGSCEPVQNQMCSGGFQCQCKGGSYPKSTNPIDNVTCKLGL
ncbi:unnamed protein product [Cylicocyclus nassatus]|uniref:Uncharacterized protein n=1 Tax=Cylicocyclus nassatus TaxID=53992 RepID=A0AA36GNH9_CYLNA|nr:unnamed protein product [Cylicocyclus nassatus]